MYSFCFQPVAMSSVPAAYNDTKDITQSPNVWTIEDSGLSFADLMEQKKVLLNFLSLILHAVVIASNTTASFNYILARPNFQFKDWKCGSRYTLKTVIGDGAYGCVAKAIDNVTNQAVAIKQVK